MTLQHGASKLEAIDEISTLVAAAAVCKYNSAEALMFQPYLWFSVCCLFLIFLGGIPRPPCNAYGVVFCSVL
jgi:hypothetical protein